MHTCICVWVCESMFDCVSVYVKVCEGVSVGVRVPTCECVCEWHRRPFRRESEALSALPPEGALHPDTLAPACRACVKAAGGGFYIENASRSARPRVIWSLQVMAFASVLLQTAHLSHRSMHKYLSCIKFIQFHKLHQYFCSKNGGVH